MITLLKACSQEVPTTVDLRQDWAPVLPEVNSLIVGYEKVPSVLEACMQNAAAGFNVQRLLAQSINFHSACL